MADTPVINAFYNAKVLAQQRIDRVLADPSTSFWMRECLKAALKRDPVDAANDAEVLARLLADRAEEIRVSMR